MTNQTYLKNLRIPTIDDPLRILISACFTGVTCGFDGKSYEGYPSIQQLRSYSTVHFVPFCPENFSYGTPREMSDCHGGDGMDVLEGKAKVLSESGIDWTAEMITASEKMLSIAQENKVELAVLMDVSAACGSQVIYLGNRYDENPTHQIGMGVCAAQLHRNGINVISQRDYASLEILFTKLDPDHAINQEALDHHQHPWVVEHFGLDK